MGLAPEDRPMDEEQPTKEEYEAWEREQTKGQMMPEQTRYRIAVKDMVWRWLLNNCSGRIWESASEGIAAQMRLDLDQQGWAGDEYRVIPSDAAGVFHLPLDEPAAASPETENPITVQVPPTSSRRVVLRPAPSPTESQRVDVEELQRMYDVSTPGEWDDSLGQASFGYKRCVVTPDGIVAAEVRHGNCQFIAAAHNAFPSLLQEIRELRIDSGNYRGKCAVCCTANCDMLTDDKCLACENDELRRQVAALRGMLLISGKPGGGLRILPQFWSDAEIDAALQERTPC